MKIIFWYPSVFIWLFIYLSSGHLALRSPFGRYMLSIGMVCFELAVTAWFVYLGVYVSPQIWPSYLKSCAFRDFQLNVKAIQNQFLVILYPFIFISLYYWPIPFFFFCFFVVGFCFCFFFSFYDGKLWISVKIVTI